MSINLVKKIIIIYFAQVATLWGFLEGYTYFQGDKLKDLLGSYWLLIYTFPLLTTAYFYYRYPYKEEMKKENIITKGDYSPGKVGANYKVVPKLHKNNKTNNKSSAKSCASTETSNTPANKNINTTGNYSPGEVGGDYTVER